MLVAVLAAALLAAPMDEARAHAMTTRVESEVARLRGLEFRRPVPVHVVDDAAAREQLMHRLRSLEPLEQIDYTARAYALLGLVPRGSDLLASVLDVLREQAGGFYDPESGAYFLLEDVPPTTAELITAHELTHALEDQHYDLDRSLREVIDDDDRAFALDALHEGSATLLMAAYAAGALARGQLRAEALAALDDPEVFPQDALRAMPVVLQRQILGPYLLGATFLRGAEPGYPRARVEQAYHARPQSSEQILHPEKYWDPARRDEPRAVELPSPEALLGAGWRLVA
ncbi:MAG TPA: hypothetical protein VJS92_12195, partial [Candidatus Polarisedimenticolaceae bacterium]|nr:hypothetical protein [Candidatus Polarisedimenticolaceae bacterium]